MDTLPDVARVAAHEAAHAVVAQVIGLGVASIVLSDELFEGRDARCYGRVQFGSYRASWDTHHLHATALVAGWMFEGGADADDPEPIRLDHKRARVLCRVSIKRGGSPYGDVDEALDVAKASAAAVLASHQREVDALALVIAERRSLEGPALDELLTTVLG